MRISELVIACFDLDGMLAFYQNVFNISFETVKIPQGAIYVGSIDEMQVTLCPASMAGIKAKDNRHQLTFLLDDIKDPVIKTKEYDGSIMQNIQETEGFLEGTIRDADGNSIVLKQKM